MASVPSLWPNGVGAALAGTNANTIIQRQYENLAVAHLSGLGGACRVDNRLDGRIHKCVVDADLQFELGQQADLELCAAIDFCVTALPAATAHIAYRHQEDIVFV